MKYLYTIKKQDVGKRQIDMGTCSCCGRKNPPLNVGDVFGNVLVADIGKRVYQNENGVLCIENQDQLNKRLGK